MKKFWCCYVEGTGGFNRKHEDYGAAEVEATRLARKEKKTVYILEAIRYGYVEETPVSFHDIYQGE